jgi:hypothetical protein
VRRWVWVLLAILAFGAVSCAGLVGTGVWFFSHHVDVKHMSRADIEAEFTSQRARFKGQEPLLNSRGDMATLSDRLEARAMAYSGPPPKSLCLLVWERGQPQRVRICLPFWLLKMKSGKGLKLDVNNKDIDRMELSAEEIQRAGPALLLDEEHDRSRVLMWTE